MMPQYRGNGIYTDILSGKGSYLLKSEVHFRLLRTTRGHPSVLKRLIGMVFETDAERRSLLLQPETRK